MKRHLPEGPFQLTIECVACKKKYEVEFQAGDVMRWGRCTGCRAHLSIFDDGVVFRTWYFAMLVSFALVLLPFVAIDTWLHHKVFEPASVWLQKALDADRFRLAIGTFVLSFLMFVFQSLANIRFDTARLWLEICILSVNGVWQSTWIWWLLDKSRRSGSESGDVLHKRDVDAIERARTFRLAFVFMIPWWIATISVGHFYSTTAFFLWYCSLHILDTRDVPPSKRKLFEDVLAWAHAFAPAAS